MAKDNSKDITHPRDGKAVYIGSYWKEIIYQARDGTTKHATIRMEYEIIERTIDKKGQFLLVPDIEANVWWTNTGFTDQEVIGHYHAHGESEQFPKPTALACELKTDMDLERLPSGKFETNELVLELAILSYNILRMIAWETEPPPETGCKALQAQDSHQQSGQYRMPCDRTRPEADHRSGEEQCLAGCIPACVLCL